MKLISEGSEDAHPVQARRDRQLPRTLCTRHGGSLNIATLAGRRPQLASEARGRSTARYMFTVAAGDDRGMAVKRT
jgi:hypothetical protein